jgi:hypothetical protein
VLTYRVFHGVLAEFCKGLSGVLLRFGVDFGRLCSKLSLYLLGRMEAWNSRFKESRERFFEDDEDDDVNMQHAVDQFQNFIDHEPPSRRAAGGSRQDKATNIERDKVIMDAQMHKDYFADHPTYDPHIFRRRYRMRRSLFCFILERVCA